VRAIKKGSIELLPLLSINLSYLLIPGRKDISFKDPRARKTNVE
jgi:hypothetical protein